VQAATFNDSRAVVDLRDELGDEPRLADPGRSKQREQLAGGFGGGALEVLAQALQFAAAPDERRVQPASEPRRIWIDPEQAVRLDNLALALQGKLDQFDAHGIADELKRLLPDQDVARCAALLESRRDVDRVSRNEGLGLAGHDLAGVDADPDLEVEAVDSLPHLGCGTHRPEGVVFARARHAEDGHHGIADELLHGSAVTLEDRAELLEVALHPRPHRLGIRAFGLRG
jgi:hypothetical protein